MSQQATKRNRAICCLAARTLAVPAALALLPAVAAAFTVYDGPVDPPPRDCNFSEVIIPDTVPRTRPLLLLDRSGATSAQVVPLGGLVPGTRRVAYTYAFSRLDFKIPPVVAGVFAPSSVRVLVYAGRTAAAPLASDQTRTGTNAISYASSALESRATPFTPFASQWLVRVSTAGPWRSDPYLPWGTARITMDCLMTIQAAGTAPPLVGK